MKVALFTTFRASRKEQLAVMLDRIRSGFAEAELEPSVTFTASDAPTPGFTSAVTRACKRFPLLQEFHSAASMLPGGDPVPMISNGPGSPAEGREIDFETLLAIAQGVPRSFPFHGIAVHFRNPAFGAPLPGAVLAPTQSPGIIVGDSWWVNGRNRSLMALSVVETDDDARSSRRKLPALPPPVASILAACGKAAKTIQVPLPGFDGAPDTLRAAQADPEVAARVAAIVGDYRSRLTEVVAAASLPHDLPPSLEALRETPLGTASGPKRPALAAAFKPLGYDCRGESGTFTLRRRTDANLTVELSLDVGTWSNSLTASYHVHGLGFTARLPLPPSARAIGSMQYPIGGPDRWARIVANLAALVGELDRSFVPAIQAASGPAPDWYQPETRP